MLFKVKKKYDNNSCLCRAFGKSVPKAKNRQKNVKLTHATKFAVSTASLRNVIKVVFQFHSLPCVWYVRSASSKVWTTLVGSMRPTTWCLRWDRPNWMIRRYGRYIYLLVVVWRWLWYTRILQCWKLQGSASLSCGWVQSRWYFAFVYEKV
jgi:hypothetical protein